MLPYIFIRPIPMTVYPCRSLNHPTHWLVVTKSPFFRLFRRRPGFDKGLEPFSKSIELQHDKGDYFEIRHRRKWTLSQVCAASSAVSEVDLIPAWVWIRPPFTPTLDIDGPPAIFYTLDLHMARFGRFLWDKRIDYPQCDQKRPDVTVILDK